METYKIYVASGWFTPEERLIKDTLLKDLFHEFRSPILLDPEHLDPTNEKLYNETHLPQYAKIIYENNIKAIGECDICVYPKDTLDPGTISDVAYSIALNKIIYKYDYKFATFEKVNFDKSKIPDINNEILILTENNFKQVSFILGFYKDKHLNYFLLKGVSDNIMLSCWHNRYIVKNNKFELLKSDKIDQNVSTDIIDFYKLDNSYKYIKDFDLDISKLFDTKLKIITGVS